MNITATQFHALKKEYKDNEATIARLKARNAKLQRAFDALAEVTGLKADLTQRTWTVKNPGIYEKVAEALHATGEQMSVHEIGDRIFGKEHTQDQANIIANMCAKLVKAERAIKIFRGTYQAAEPQSPQLPGLIPEEAISTSFGEPKVQTVSIGHDTRLSRTLV